MGILGVEKIFEDPLESLGLDENPLLTLMIGFSSTEVLRILFLFRSFLMISMLYCPTLLLLMSPMTLSFAKVFKSGLALVITLTSDIGSKK